MNLTSLKQKIRIAGPDKLFVVSDFDRTLTYGAVNGVKTPSIISMLHHGNYLSAEYILKSEQLHAKYAAIEIDHNIPQAELKKAMQEWWELHFALLIEAGLNLKHVQSLVADGPIKLRTGLSEFLELLSEKDIPLIIFSASGLGEAIPMYIAQITQQYSNIHYITNRLNWDEKGRFISVRGKIITSTNKAEVGLSNYPEIESAVSGRNSLLLLGDSLDDVDMAKNFTYDNLLKVGFMNPDYNPNQERYKNAFDILFPGDQGLQKLNQILVSLLR